LFGDETLCAAVAESGLHGWGFTALEPGAVAEPAAPVDPLDAAALRDAVMAARRPGVRGVPACVAAVRHATELDREVLNGGFAQYLLNTRGRRLRALVAAVEALGVPAASAVVDAVVRWWDEGVAERAAFFRAGVFGARSPLATRLHPLDRRYAKLRLDLAILSYATTHAAERDAWLRSKN
jgi:hypothetical protein